MEPGGCPQPALLVVRAGGALLLHYFCRRIAYIAPANPVLAQVLLCLAQVPQYPVQVPVFWVQVPTKMAQAPLFLVQAQTKMAQACFFSRGLRQQNAQNTDSRCRPRIFFQTCAKQYRTCAMKSGHLFTPIILSTSLRSILKQRASWGTEVR